MIHVIIPVLNRPEYTALCLEAIKTVDHGCDIRPILVDCGCRPKTSKLLLDWAAENPGMSPKVVNTTINKGFSFAINAAVASIENLASSFVCILHNDTIPFDGWAGEMRSCFDEYDEDVAVIIPRTCYANEGSPCIPELRDKFQAVKPPNKVPITTEAIKGILAGLYPDRKKFMDDLKAQVQFKASYAPEISSFCMLTRGKYFIDYGKFDEDFWPRGWEDKFWFRPMERDGYTCMISNKSFVHHFGNITSDGPGFIFPDGMKINEEKYRAKCLELDKKSPSTDRKTPVV